MPRTPAEWIGKTDDTAIPPRVRDRVFDAKKGRCHRCTRTINAAGGEDWTCEHVIALINGGKNRESNLDCTCENCLPLKNADDAAKKKKSTQVRYRSKGITAKTARPMRGQGFSRDRAKYSRARGIWVDIETDEPLDPQPAN